MSRLYDLLLAMELFEMFEEQKEQEKKREEEMLPKLRAEKIIEPLRDWLGALPIYTPADGGPSGSKATREDLVRGGEVLDDVVGEIVKFGSDMFDRGFQHANRILMTGVEFGSHLEAAILKALEPLTYRSVMDADGDAVDRTLKNVAVLIHDYERNAFDRGVAASVGRTVGYPRPTPVEIVPPIAIEIHGLDPTIYRWNSLSGIYKYDGPTTAHFIVVKFNDGRDSHPHRFETVEERDREYDRLRELLMYPLRKSLRSRILGTSPFAKRE